MSRPCSTSSSATSALESRRRTDDTLVLYERRRLPYRERRLNEPGRRPGGREGGYGPRAFRCHRDRGRPRGLRGRGGGGARRRGDPAHHPEARNHRRDVVQSSDRRARQGHARAGGGRARRAHGPHRRRGGHSVPRAQSQQGPGGARAPGAAGSRALPRGHAGGARRPTQPDDPGGHGRRPGARRVGAGAALRARRAAGGRDADSGTAGCAHHRHIPAWPHPYRGAADPGGPRRRRAGDGPCAHFGTARLPPRPAEDRHPAKARRPHHRLGRAGSAGGRRAARALLLSYWCDHAGAGALPHHRHGA